MEEPEGEWLPESKLMTVDLQERNTCRSDVKSAMCAASQVP